MSEVDKRRYKEIGAKFYIVCLHIIVIIGLWGLYKSTIVEPNGYRFVFMIGLFIFIRRLYIVHQLKKEANEKGMKLTEYTDYLNEKKDDDTTDNDISW